MKKCSPFELCNPLIHRPHRYKVEDKKAHLGCSKYPGSLCLFCLFLFLLFFIHIFSIMTPVSKAVFHWFILEIADHNTHRYYRSFTLEHWGKYMDYTWIVSAPTGSSGDILTSVGALGHSSVDVFVEAFCKSWCVGFIWVCQLVFSLVNSSACGRQRGKMEGWASPHLCCIVVKATQILQSSLVAELVLILEEIDIQERGEVIKTYSSYFVLSVMLIKPDWFWMSYCTKAERYGRNEYPDNHKDIVLYRYIQFQYAKSRVKLILDYI